MRILVSKFLNLIVNAAHAIDEMVDDATLGTGNISISTRRDGDHVEIQVGDTGRGIPEAIQERVFEAFFTTKDVGKGTGQGLALAHAIVAERHGGTLRFESEAGEGTTFFFTFPLADSSSATTASQKVA